jgi:hypothetical protein
MWFHALEPADDQTPKGAVVVNQSYLWVTQHTEWYLVHSRQNNSERSNS